MGEARKIKATEKRRGPKVCNNRQTGTRQIEREREVECIGMDVICSGPIMADYFDVCINGCVYFVCLFKMMHIIWQYYEFITCEYLYGILVNMFSI